jgi:hypothetical protein
MSIDYEFAGWFPFDDPADVAMRAVADAVGAPGGSRIQHDGLRVYPVVPEADEVEIVRGHLGHDANLSLMFVPADAAAARLILGAAAALAPLNVRGLLFSDYGDDESLILSVADGKVTLNESWTGPLDLRSAPPPYATARLAFAAP